MGHEHPERISNRQWLIFLDVNVVVLLIVQEHLERTKTIWPEVEGSVIWYAAEDTDLLYVLPYFLHTLSQ